MASLHANIAQERAKKADKILGKIGNLVQKGKVYLKPDEHSPEGSQEFQGKRGGRFYVSGTKNAQKIVGGGQANLGQKKVQNYLSPESYNYLQRLKEDISSEPEYLEEFNNMLDFVQDYINIANNIYDDKKITNRIRDSIPRMDNLFEKYNDLVQEYEGYPEEQKIFVKAIKDLEKIHKELNMSLQGGGRREKILAFDHLVNLMHTVGNSFPEMFESGYGSYALDDTFAELFDNMAGKVSKLRKDQPSEDPLKNPEYAGYGGLSMENTNTIGTAEMVSKGKVYLKPGEHSPEGHQEFQGKRGGRFYHTFEGWYPPESWQNPKTEEEKKDIKENKKRLEEDDIRRQKEYAQYIKEHGDIEEPEAEVQQYPKVNNSIIQDISQNGYSPKKYPVKTYRKNHQGINLHINSTTGHNVLDYINDNDDFRYYDMPITEYQVKGMNEALQFIQDYIDFAHGALTPQREKIVVENFRNKLASFIEESQAMSLGKNKYYQDGELQHLGEAKRLLKKIDQTIAGKTKFDFSNALETIANGIHSSGYMFNMYDQADVSDVAQRVFDNLLGNPEDINKSLLLNKINKLTKEGQPQEDPLQNPAYAGYGAPSMENTNTMGTVPMTKEFGMAADVNTPCYGGGSNKARIQNRIKAILGKSITSIENDAKQVQPKTKTQKEILEDIQHFQDKVSKSFDQEIIVQEFLQGYEKLALLSKSFSGQEFNQLLQSAMTINNLQQFGKSIGNAKDRIDQVVFIDSIAHSLHQNKLPDGSSIYKQLDELADISKAVGEKQRQERLLLLQSPAYNISKLEKLSGGINILQKGLSFWNLYNKAVKDGVENLSDPELVMLREFIWSQI
jgi:hypothetical protein